MGKLIGLMIKDNELFPEKHFPVKVLLRRNLMDGGIALFVCI